MSALDRALSLAPWLAATLMTAAIVHLASILLMPALAPRDAFARLETLAPRASLTPLAPARPGREIAPFGDPAMAVAICRYDLRDGPLRLRAELTGDDFVSFSFHARGAAIFYAMTDKAAFRGVIDVLVVTPQQLEALEAADPEDEIPAETRLVSPTLEGFVYMRSLAALPWQAEEAAARLRKVECAAEAL
ncbi:MAG: hypothetical protein JNK46_11975 [Methylobacteriaceae bacterium]|nr:hypothetical protein [Methylobacteriaceae bacterium]